MSYLDRLKPYDESLGPSPAAGSGVLEDILVKCRLARARELYVLAAYGTSSRHIEAEYGIPPSVQEEVTGGYAESRRQHFDKFSLGDRAADLFMGYELLARMKVSDRHLPGHLRELRQITFASSPDGLFSFPEKESVGRYFGSDAQQVFYNTKEVSIELQLPVKEIDRRAKLAGVGRKIKPDNEHSNYLLTRADIEIIRSTHRPWVRR